MGQITLEDLDDLDQEFGGHVDLEADPDIILDYMVRRRQTDSTVPCLSKSSSTVALLHSDKPLMEDICYGSLPRIINVSLFSYVPSRYVM